MPLVRKPGLIPPAAALDAAQELTGLQSLDPTERWSAARAASKVPGCEAALAQALNAERDPRVREAILTSLSQMGTSAAIEPMMALVRSDEAATRTAALDALRLTPVLPRIIARLLEDSDADVRLLSCDLLRALPPALANALLAELLLKETQPNVCAAAVEVLAEVGEPSALDALAACAKRFPDNDFLLFAIKAVAERIPAAPASPRV